MNVNKTHILLVHVGQQRCTASRKALSALPTIPDYRRYIIGVFCYNFKSQTNILASN